MSEKNTNTKRCTFSTGICGSLTCSKDGRFCQYGYPINPCPEYPCDKYNTLTADLLAMRKARHEEQCKEALSCHHLLDENGNITADEAGVIESLRSWGHTALDFDKCICRTDV